ncbi:MULTISPECIES: sensor histidine kinase [Pseudomonas]|uniref:Sensor histidine kinase n=1 Tax=Pseudomonas sessilinigenes TaxID=658629 RepID=A0ABX8MJ71_9PSED|nr:MULTISPECIES: sensor histidine kinase [Pseudomonas]AZC27366.1 Sensor histidine kinase [Pseudomonas sessilinigenes]QIH09523.1 sensor histidine kinase [Pseudomonas sp. BIOMIG1BAC]QXH38723.1 sensor histidine kinase [Pseudomonas sessilinigenes]
MSSPSLDPASALALRSQYRQAQSRAARLRLLVDTGQELLQLPPAQVRQRVLQRACAFAAMDHGLLLEWGTDGVVQLSAGHGSNEHLQTLHAQAGSPLQEQPWPASQDPSLVRVPLQGADGRVFGILLLANSVPISPVHNEDLESLQLLATLLATHLENQRLLQALQARERSMSELVQRLFSAQEDERRRVAYDLHDGLAQTLAGLHQRLQGFAGCCPPLPTPLHDQLQAILQLAQGCVGEGRQLIGGLRPHVLDDFGLLRAIDREADRLRDAGLAVHWQQRCPQRLPGALETALFRIAQEAINNILKHAGASHTELSLALEQDQAVLCISDNGRGLPDPPVHGLEHWGQLAMQERAHLLGGHFTCDSQPAGGTRILVRVPLLTREHTA